MPPQSPVATDNIVAMIGVHTEPYSPDPRSRQNPRPVHTHAEARWRALKQTPRQQPQVPRYDDPRFPPPRRHPASPFPPLASRVVQPAPRQPGPQLPMQRFQEYPNAANIPNSSIHQLPPRTSSNSMHYDGPPPRGVGYYLPPGYNPEIQKPNTRPARMISPPTIRQRTDRVVGRLEEGAVTNQVVDNMNMVMMPKSKKKQIKGTKETSSSGATSTTSEKSGVKSILKQGKYSGDSQSGNESSSSGISYDPSSLDSSSSSFQLSTVDFTEPVTYFFDDPLLGSQPQEGYTDDVDFLLCDFPSEGRSESGDGDLLVDFPSTRRSEDQMEQTVAAVARTRNHQRDIARKREYAARMARARAAYNYIGK